MKAFLTTFLVLISVHAWCQINFKTAQKNLIDTKSDFKTLSIGDINNDGLNDLIFGTWNDRVVVDKQTPEGTLSNDVGYFKYPTPNLTVVKVADVNNDKLNDIVVAYSDSIAIFYQSPTGSLSSIRATSFLGSQLQVLQTADLNNDGLMDIVSYENSSETLKIMYQNLNGTFATSSVKSNTTGCQQIEVADLNNDNLTDVLIISNSNLQVFYQQQNLGITSSYSSTFTHTGKWNGIAMGDINNDGLIDVVGTNVSDNGEAFIVILTQNSTNQIDFTTEKIIPIYKNPVVIKIADLNCDGSKELIVGHNGESEVTIYEQDKSQQYHSSILFWAATDYNPNSLAIGDLNNDKKLDIATLNKDNLKLLYNISKPRTFDKIDITVEYRVNKKEVTTETSTQTTDEFKEVSTQQIAYEHFEGDSIKIRQATLCNSVYKDTIVHPFKYDKTTVISSDVVRTPIVKDDVSISLLDNIVIYPNPVKDKLTLEISELIQENKIEIYDFEGRKLISKRLLGKKSEINLSQLRQEIYFLKIQSDKGSLIKKIVKL